MKSSLSLVLTILASSWLMAAPAASAASKRAESYRLSCGAVMQVEACSPHLVRVRVSPTGTFPESLMERYGILKTDWPAFDGPACRVQFDAATETLTLLDGSGQVLVSGISFQPGGSALSRVLRDSIQVQYGDMVTRRNGGIIGDDDGSLSEMDKTEGGGQFLPIQEMVTEGGLQKPVFDRDNYRASDMKILILEGHGTMNSFDCLAL